MNYYNMTVCECLNALNSSENGLSEKEVLLSKEKYGENIVCYKKKKNVIKIFLSQFKDLLVVILLICAFVSFISSNIGSGIVIVLVLNMNAIIGTIQYIKALKSLEILNDIEENDALVIRSGKQQIIKETMIVVGDIMVLKYGDIVKADGRIIENNQLEIDESLITGEAVGVFKNTTKINGETPINEQTNMIYSGSKIMNGNGLAVVTNVGNNSFMGTIFKMMSNEKNEKTPLEKSLNDLSTKLAMIILLICASVYMIRVFQGYNIMESAMFSIALAVAAIPEAMGSIVTICLAIGVLKLANSKALVKNLKKVETLGSVSVICSDKTGTITKNEMVVVKCYDYKYHEKINNDDLLEALILCNDTIGKSKTDEALLQYAIDNGMDINKIKEKSNIIEIMPFSSANKYMSVVYNEKNKKYKIFKGAYEVLKDKIIYMNNHIISQKNRLKLDEIHNEMSSSGLRVITVLKGEDEMHFLGFLGILDPPKENVSDAIKRCHMAKIKVMMITGDNPLTACAIAKEVGIPSDAYLTGKDISSLSDYELRNKIRNTFVYARTTPNDKLRLVRALKENNEIVAMTGDGINDAPALKKADIGISMASGMEVTKEASDIILLDNDFKTISYAIFNGRNIYFNIRNAIRFLISGNMAGLIIAIYSTLMNMPFPFLPVHLLFINLLTDSLPAIAIGLEKANPKIMQYPPRNPKEKILSKNTMKKILAEGILIALVTIASYYIGLKNDHFSFCFLVLCISRLFAGFNPRGEGSIFRYGIKNKWIIYSFILGIGLVNMVMFIPFLTNIFCIDDFNMYEIFLIYFLAFLPTLIIQTTKFIVEGRKNNA